MATQCVTCSANCCNVYEVDIDKHEYEKYQILGLSYGFETFVERLQSKTPDIQINQNLCDKILARSPYHGYATAKKGKGGDCVFLGKESRMCRIYDMRPRVCKEYTTERCEGIR